MMPTTTRPKKKTPAEIRLAGEAITYAIQHDGHAAATVALVEKYAAKIQGDARGYLVQFAAEAFGGFCDRTAAGFIAWAEGDEIQCPSCDDNAMTLTDGVFTCGACGHKESR